MPDLVVGEYREPPERVNRTTRSGADQYVLACNARRDADAATFSHIERLERENSELRREVAWKRKHASSFTGKWFGGRLVLSLYIIAIATSFGFWLFTPDGRTFRVAFGVGSIDVKGGARVERSFLTSDMTQHEIDSIAATVRTNQTSTKDP